MESTRYSLLIHSLLLRLMRDYRDQLEQLFQSLREREGISYYRISQRAGLTEQRLSNLLKKKTNLSVPSLETTLANLGYCITFEPRETAATGTSPKADKRAMEGK
jgi:transcriptional regulator with XRE-family HTH domain